MIKAKDYIGSYFVHKTLHLKCDCVVGIDITGICTGYEIKGNEIILMIQQKNKNILVGLNTPNLYLEIL